MSQTVTDTQVDVRDLPSALLPLREQILADLTMLAQIPAPTGEEEQRVRYVLDRFVEAGVPEVGPDEVGQRCRSATGSTWRTDDLAGGTRGHNLPSHSESQRHTGT